MPLYDLIGAIKTLQGRLNLHRVELQANETRTRMALVDPLLVALGWDTADPSIVKAEYDVDGEGRREGRADYALLGPGGRPVACIEAKRLGEPLAAHRMQMLTYSNASAIKYAGLTDGNHWQLYDVFRQARLDDRNVLDLKITENPPYECALKLIALWRPNLTGDRLVEANMSILHEERRLGKASEATPEVEPSLPMPNLGWKQLTAYDPPGGTAPPSAIRLPDGSLRSVERWYDLLVHTAEWLWSLGSFTNDQVPVSSGPRRYLISSEPIHPDGTRFRTPRLIPSAKLTLEAHRNAASCRANTTKLMASCGQDPMGVWVQPSV